MLYSKQLLSKHGTSCFQIKKYKRKVTVSVKNRTMTGKLNYKTLMYKNVFYNIKVQKKTLNQSKECFKSEKRKSDVSFFFLYSKCIWL